MQGLKTAEQKVQAKTTRTQGSHVPMTYEEQIRLEQQKHVRFNELPVEYQAKLAAERESLWGQIPAHIQAKSRKLAGR